METYLLNDGAWLPVIGYGTYKNPDGDTGVRAVADALECGYRLIDTAAAYGNEREVGEALRQSGVARAEVCVTSKVYNPDRGYDSTLRAFERTMQALRLDSLDLYLLHWPASPSRSDDWQRINADTWRAMERLVDEHAVRSIGLSNFLPHHLEPLWAGANIPPAVNQIEFHPGFMQRDCLDWCRGRGIRVEGWSPLGRLRLQDNPLLRSIAADHGRTVAQICLRWALQHGVVPLPKSENRDRIRQNIDIFDFTLTLAEMEAIDAMPETGASGLHPDTITF